MKYSGSEWIEQSLKKSMSPLGKNVADLLGDVFKGIYHLDTSALKRVDWLDNYCIEYTHWGDLATVDFNHLTELVVLAHDRMIRVNVRGIGPGYMKMLFHQRETREGSITERCPTIESHINQIRNHCNL